MNNYPKKIIGERVKFYREYGLCTREELLDRIAERCGYHISSELLAKVENGNSYPPPELLIGMDCTGFATVDQILLGENRALVYQLEKGLIQLSERSYEGFLDELFQFAPELGDVESDDFETEDDLADWETGLEPVSNCTDIMRYIRKSLGWTKARTARSIGVGKNAVLENEQNDGFPTTKYLLAFCAGTGASASDILGTHCSLPYRLLQIQTILDCYPYGTQTVLLQKFSQILEKYL